MLRVKNPDRKGYSLQNSDHWLKPTSKGIVHSLLLVPSTPAMDCACLIWMTHFRPATGTQEKNFQFQRKHFIVKNKSQHLLRRKSFNEKNGL